jgi:hypothetical protein
MHLRCCFTIYMTLSIVLTRYVNSSARGDYRVIISWRTPSPPTHNPRGYPIALSSAAIVVISISFRSRRYGYHLFHWF